MIQFVVGAAAGYVFGTKAGRKRYHQIKRGAETVINSPVTRQALTSARKAIANRLDPQPRMREIKNLKKRNQVDGQEILERDED